MQSADEGSIQTGNESMRRAITRWSLTTYRIFAMSSRYRDELDPVRLLFSPEETFRILLAFGTIHLVLLYLIPLSIVPLLIPYGLLSLIFSTVAGGSAYVGLQGRMGWRRSILLTGGSLILLGSLFVSAPGCEVRSANSLFGLPKVSIAAGIGEAAGIPIPAAVAYVSAPNGCSIELFLNAYVVGYGLLFGGLVSPRS